MHQLLQSSTWVVPAKRWMEGRQCQATAGMAHTDNNIIQDDIIILITI
jgi:hypothetical protein